MQRSSDVVLAYVGILAACVGGYRLGDSIAQWQIKNSLLPGDRVIVVAHCLKKGDERRVALFHESETGLLSFPIGPAIGREYAAPSFFNWRTREYSGALAAQRELRMATGVTADLEAFKRVIEFTEDAGRVSIYAVNAGRLFNFRSVQWKKRGDFAGSHDDGYVPMTAKLVANGWVFDLVG